MTCQPAFPVFSEPPDENAGNPVLSDPACCWDLWAAGLRLYLADARAWARTGKAPDAGEAYRDLHSGRRLLARLCDPLGLDAHLVGDAILAALAPLPD